MATASRTFRRTAQCICSATSGETANMPREKPLPRLTIDNRNDRVHKEAAVYPHRLRVVPVDAREGNRLRYHESSHLVHTRLVPAAPSARTAEERS